MTATKLRTEYQIVETTDGYGSYVYGEPLSIVAAKRRCAERNAEYQRVGRTWAIVSRKISDWERWPN